MVLTGYPAAASRPFDDFEPQPQEDLGDLFHRPGENVRPPQDGGAPRKRNVDRLHSGAPEFKDAAEKYEGGGLPFHLLYAMEASVDWMLEIGPDAIEARVMELANSARTILRGFGGIA